MLTDRTARRTSRASRLSNAIAPTVEALEKRTLLFNVGGDWENEDDLAFSYANVFDGGIQDASNNALPDSTIRSAILEAMSVWAGVVPVKIHQEADAGPNPSDLAYFGFDRQLRFGHHLDDGMPASDDAIGHAWGPDDLSSLAGDVHLDKGNDWGTFVGSTTSDILEVLVHEVGHALGMQHEDDLSCLMNSNQQDFYTGLGSAFLFQDDINGIQSLYGSGLGYVLTDVDRLLVSGTNNADTITVDYDSASDELIVTSVGIGSFRIDEDEVLEIVIDTRGGNDTIRIEGLDGDTTAVVNAGSGNDSINVGDTDFNSNVLSDVTVNGGTGTDEIILRDGEDDAGNDTYNINPANFSKPGSNLLSYPAGDLEVLTVVGSGNDDTFNVLGSAINSSFDIVLEGNDGADTFNVDSVESAIDVSVLGGTGSDTITVGNEYFDVYIHGSVDVDGGDSGDTLIINDIDDVGGDLYEIDAASFNKDSGTGSVTFSNISSFRVDSSGGGSEIDVLGVASGTSVTVDGRAGEDIFTVGDYDFDSNILGTLILSGGGGTTDYLEILDSSDSGADTYRFGESGTFGNFFEKDPGELIIFDTIEEVHLLANNSDNTINVDDIELGTAVTVYGLGGNDDIFIGAGDLDNIAENLVIWAGAGNDTITFDDSLDAPVGLGGFPDSYRITDSTVVKVQPFPLFEKQFDYFEVEEIVVDGNADGNTFTVQSTGADATLNGNDGNDRYNLGLNDNVKDIQGTVEADGGGGADTLNYNDGAAVLDRTYVVSPNDLSRTGVAITKPHVDVIVVNAGTGNDTLDVTNNVPTTVNGGDGDDAFTAAGGLWDFAVMGALTIDGGVGTDSLLIDDTGAATTGDYTISATQSDKSTPFSAPINYTTFESYELSGTGGANVFTVTGTIVGDSIVRGRGGADQFDVFNTANGHPLRVEDGSELDIVRVNPDNVGTAAIEFTTSQGLASLSLSNGGRAELTAGGDKILNTQSLSFSGNGALDLTDNVMVVDWSIASPINAIGNFLRTGYNGGLWNGAGVRTSLGDASQFALGYAESSALTTIPVIFGSFTGDAVLVRYTRYGDADLGSSVDSDDFNRQATNFGLTGKRWSDGNVNYDAASFVNSDDFNLLAGNFGSAVLAASRSVLPISGGDDDDQPGTRLLDELS